jgi:hypothetical protein
MKPKLYALMAGMVATALSTNVLAASPNAAGIQVKERSVRQSLSLRLAQANSPGVDGFGLDMADTATRPHRADAPDSGGSATWYPKGSYEYWRLSDGKCDNRYVYLQYKKGYFIDPPPKPVRVENHEGCRNAIEVPVPRAVINGDWVTWRICTNYTAGPDSCSRWQKSKA